MKQEARHSTPLPSRLRIHEDSRLISKDAPKIRIIHIFAPKIIKTDEANFRELVQSLTGQRSRSNGTSSTKISTISQPKVSKADPEPRKTAQLERRSNVQDSDHSGVWKESNIQILNPINRETVSLSNMIQEKSWIPILQNEEKVKKDFQDKSNFKGRYSNNGFLLAGFPDMEGLLQDPSEFPSLLPKYSQMNFLGGMPWPLS